MWYNHNVRSLLIVLLLVAPAWAHDAFVVDPSQMPMILRAIPSQTWFIQGSGAIIAPGIILTAQHLLDADQSLPLYVRLPSGNVPARIGCLTPANADAAVLLADIPSSHDHPVVINSVPPAPHETVVVAGWPSGRWTVMHSSVRRYQQQVRLTSGMVITEVGWIDQNLGDERFKGFSGSAVFDEQGALRGFICCVRVSERELGMVPIRHVLAACALQ